jgi:hypothetical protein
MNLYELIGTNPYPKFPKLGYLGGTYFSVPAIA